jgi:hypothetical protein
MMMQLVSVRAHPYLFPPFYFTLGQLAYTPNLNWMRQPPHRAYMIWEGGPSAGLVSAMDQVPTALFFPLVVVERRSPAPASTADLRPAEDAGGEAFMTRRGAVLGERVSSDGPIPIT